MLEKDWGKKKSYSCDTKGTEDVQGTQQVYNYDALSPYCMLKGGLTIFKNYLDTHFFFKFCA